jgi:hypothetical protein
MKWFRLGIAAALAMSMVLLVSVPLRVRSLVAAADLGGVSGPPVLDQGAEAWAVVLPFKFPVPRNATIVEVQLRHTGEQDRTVTLELWIDGDYRDRLTVDGAWRRYVVQVPSLRTHERQIRFELRAPVTVREPLPQLLTRRITFRT